MLVGKTTPLLVWILCIVAALPAIAAEISGSNRRVVVIVWDGMRPDFVTEEKTPALWKLATGGVNFRNHHAVYPTSTEVNGVALATGVYPGRNGIVANSEYRPEIDNKRSIADENASVIGKGDKLSGGRYVTAPTIAELIQKSGGRTVIASAKTVGLLLDRHLDVARGKDSVTLFAGKSIPPGALAPIVAQLGPFPEQIPNVNRDNWTTKALTESLWKAGLPAFSLLWLSEPDDTEHRFAPGSKEAVAAIKSSDDNLQRVLAALDRQNARATTDIFIVSDHGFSTIERSVDLRKILRDAGFDAVTAFTHEPKLGQIMIVGNGGTVLYYVVGHDTAVTGKLVDFLEQSDFAGVIFTREKLEGTFSLDQGRIDSEHAPDVAMTFRWNENKNQFGVPGMIDADWNRKAGQGTHATLSRFDVHNTLIAAGPDFQRGQVDDLPSGNADLAPTILHILGITPPGQLDGRVLSEAMNKIEKQTPRPDTETIEATKKFPSGHWRQTLGVSHIGSTMYLDQGNGAFVISKL